MKAAITARNVGVKIEEQTILKNISATIPGGKITGLLGPSGAGKTTFIRAIIGRQRFQHGTIQVFDKPAGHAELRGKIGYMTQSPAVYNDLTVAENLRYFAEMMGVSKNDSLKAIDKVGLRHQRQQLVSTLSGGQKSRASLAVALLGKPQLLVLDEPTVGVDPVLRNELWQMFRNLAEQGVTILVTSHVMDEASRCDQLLLIRDGSLIAQGTPAELKQQSNVDSVEAAFLQLVGATS